MPEIIAFVQGLIKQGKAYESEGDVYFDISSFPQYGRLSKHKLEDLIAGARVEVNERKRSPLDFALWKHAQADEPGWESPIFYIGSRLLTAKWKYRAKRVKGVRLRSRYPLARRQATPP